MKIRMRKLSNNDYIHAGNFCELLFLSLVMANNILKPRTTIMVMAGAILAFLGLVFLARGQSGGYEWLLN